MYCLNKCIQCQTHQGYIQEKSQIEIQNTPLFLHAQIGEVHEYYTEMVALVVTSIVLQVQHTLVLRQSILPLLTFSPLLTA